MSWLAIALSVVIALEALAAVAIVAYDAGRMVGRDEVADEFMALLSPEVTAALSQLEADRHVAAARRQAMWN